MRTIFKVFIDFVTILLLLFMFWFFDRRLHGILAPSQGWNLHTLCWNGKS